MKAILLFFLLLSSSVCFSQVNKVHFKVEDITESEDLSYDFFLFRIGKYYVRQMPSFSKPYTYSNTLYKHQLNYLTDTLYVQHPDYSFDTLPMAYHNFTFEADRVILHIPARPFYNFYRNHSFPIATSYKTRNANIKLKVFCKGYGKKPRITLRLLKTNNVYVLKPSPYQDNFYEQTLAYDALANGTFEVVQGKDTTAFPFEAKQWFQTQYLLPKPEQKPSKREQGLIESYLDYVKKSQDKVREIRESFGEERDSLTSLIYRLQGKIEPPDPPEPLLEPEPNPIHTQDAKPRIGFKYFFEDLRRSLPRSIEFGGNITLELEVLKDGSTREKVLHQMQESSRLLSAIRAYLRKQTWQVAKRRGRPHRQKIILSLDFSPDAQALARTRKFEPEEGMLKIDPKQSKTLQLKVGQKAYFQIEVHGSVGLWAKVKAEDEVVFKRLDGHFAYHKAQIRGKTGGDRATKTYVFEAKKKGKTKLNIEKVFRSEVLYKSSVKIVVK